MESVYGKAVGCVAVAHVFTRHTMASIFGVSHIARHARLTLSSHRVVFAFCARVEFLWTQAIAVAIAVAGKLAVGACPGKVTGAEVRCSAGSVLTRLLAHRLAQPSCCASVTCLAVALIPKVYILAVLRNRVTVVMAIQTLIFQGTFCKMPGTDFLCSCVPFRCAVLGLWTTVTRKGSCKRARGTETLA